MEINAKERLKSRTDLERHIQHAAMTQHKKYISYFPERIDILTIQQQLVLTVQKKSTSKNLVVFHTASAVFSAECSTSFVQF